MNAPKNKSCWLIIGLIFLVAAIGCYGYYDYHIAFAKEKFLMVTERKNDLPAPRSVQILDMVGPKDSYSGEIQKNMSDAYVFHVKWSKKQAQQVKEILKPHAINNDIEKLLAAYPEEIRVKRSHLIMSRVDQESLLWASRSGQFSVSGNWLRFLYITSYHDYEEAIITAVVGRPR